MTQMKLQLAEATSWSPVLPLGRQSSQQKQYDLLLQEVSPDLL